MKLNQTKKWFTSRIPREQNLEITAGTPDPPGDHPHRLALLHARQRPVARSYLEPALIFMFLDHVRRGVLANKPRVTTKAKRSAAQKEAASVLSWLDSHLAMMQQADQVRVTVERDKQLIAMSPQIGDLHQAPTELVTKVKEAIKAMEFLKDDRAAQAFLQEVVDVNELPVLA